MYINAHTHQRPCGQPMLALVNLSPGDPVETADGAVCSVGLHPWNVGVGWREQVDMVRAAAACEHVLAIGECGLDKTRGGDYGLQRMAFAAQLDVARELGKPVVVHCVKATDELLRLLRPADRVLLHGFRGKWATACQLHAKGVTLSFGSRCNIDTLRHAHEARIPFLLETDDAPADDIVQVYRQAAAHLGISLSQLEHHCQQSWQHLFTRPSQSLCR